MHDAAEWDDVCWELVMCCEPDETGDTGFLPPSAALIAKFCKLYPQWEERLIDFAASCRTMDILASKYPAAATDEEIQHYVRSSMKAFRAALKKKDRKRK